MFSLSFIAMVIMLVFNLFPASSLAVHRARQEMQAGALAQSGLETLRARPFSQLTLGSRPQPEVAVDGIVYHVTWEVFKVDGPSPDRLLGLRATVRWQDQRKDHVVSQEAQVARLPR